LSKGRCSSKFSYIIKSGIKNSGSKFPETEYTSLEDAYEKIFQHITPTYSHIGKAANYLTEFEYDNNNSMTTLENFKSSITW
jgi:hypothetical protein